MCRPRRRWIDIPWLVGLPIGGSAAAAPHGAAHGGYGGDGMTDNMEIEHVRVEQELEQAQEELERLERRLQQRLTCSERGLTETWDQTLCCRYLVIV